jgi:methionyl-tRNA formyltransferase
MGTPQFAVTSLDALIKAGSDIVAVVTAPDKPAGRGQKVSESAVKQYAVANGLKVLQPEKLKNEDFIAELKALHADLQVVVAFRMLPEAVWNMPPKGTINLHASLLPQYRGAAPINWALINGEKESGVTTFFLKHDIDTGNILFTEKITLTGHEQRCRIIGKNSKSG